MACPYGGQALSGMRMRTWSPRKKQRYVRYGLYGVSGLVALSAAGVLGITVVRRPEAGDTAGSGPGGPSHSSGARPPGSGKGVSPRPAEPAEKRGQTPFPADVVALAQKRMTRTVVPKPPPAAATPPVTPLDKLVKLVGLMEYPQAEKSEAVIRTLANNRNKAYRAGDAVEGVPVKVKTVNGNVVVEYEGKKYRLTFKGVEQEAIGAKPSDQTAQ